MAKKKAAKRKTAASTTDGPATVRPALTGPYMVTEVRQTHADGQWRHVILTPQPLKGAARGALHLQVAEDDVLDFAIGSKHTVTITRLSVN